MLVSVMTVEGGVDGHHAMIRLHGFGVMPLSCVSLSCLSVLPVAHERPSSHIAAASTRTFTKREHKRRAPYGGYELLSVHAERLVMKDYLHHSGSLADFLQSFNELQSRSLASSSPCTAL